MAGASHATTIQRPHIMLNVRSAIQAKKEGLDMSTQFESEFSKLLQQAVNDALKRRGRLNIIITGNVGVGKSTLINAVFQGNLATTGDGLPVTQGTREIKKESIPLSIFDTRGLEKGKYQETVQALENLIQEKQESRDPYQHIHVAWICILEESRRVENADIELAKMLTRYVPVVAVITKCISDRGFRQIVQDILPQARNVVRVHAKETILDDGHKIGVMGLENLVELTMELVPEAVKNAFSASQRISLKIKLQRAHAAVATAAASAASVGAIPVPFADAIALVPIQIGMLATISALWGIPVSRVLLGTLVGGSITSSVGTIGGRALAGRLLKLIPVVGSVTGAVITAAVASTVTTAFGEAYIATLYALTKDDPGRIPMPEEIREGFQHQLKKPK